MHFLQQTHAATHRWAMAVVRPLGLQSKNVFFSPTSNRASGEALSLAPFCLLFGSPVPVTRAVPQSCPLQCQLWWVPGHHQGLWVLGQNSWSQKLLKADFCFHPKDFPYRKRTLCCSIQSALWSPPMLQTAFASVLTGRSSALPYSKVFMYSSSSWEGISTHISKEAKTVFLGAMARNWLLAIWLCISYLTIPFSKRKMACIWVRD